MKVTSPMKLMPDPDNEGEWVLVNNTQVKPGDKLLFTYPDNTTSIITNIGILTIEGKKIIASTVYLSDTIPIITKEEIIWCARLTGFFMLCLQSFINYASRKLRG